MGDGFIKEAKMKLSSNKKYSENDKALFDVIPKGETVKLDSKTIVKRFYHGRVPLNGQVCVMAGIRTLRRKIKHYHEPFQLMISERRGPHPVEIWMEAK